MKVRCDGGPFDGETMDTDLAVNHYEWRKFMRVGAESVPTVMSGRYVVHKNTEDDETVGYFRG